ncbi:endothelin-converting enzyme homolog [Musca domestica]|uniref:Phosphate-regulating neutral endopeptidase n=1 Tax=Musca domestica TaxID=7370 RepID=A0A1I8MW54_MUSDO|nr:endothelin-converting enzyme homolog [Musca domestica]
MSLKFSGLLVLGSLLLSSALGSIINVTSAAESPTKLNSTTSANVTVDNTIFKLPSEIDEDELLHETGLFMQSLMNLDVDPCENFYEFACGNWRTSERVPSSGRKDSMLRVIQSEINDLIVAFLKNNTKEGKSAEGKAKIFYASCVTGGKDINVGLKTMLDNEKENFGKLKLTGKNDWIPVNFMSPYTVFPLLPLSVNYSTFSRQFEISINRPIAALKSFYNTSQAEELLQKMGQVVSEFKTMLEFEKNLTSKVPTKDFAERMPLQDFLVQHQKDPIDWNLIFKTAFGDNTQREWYVNNQISNFTDLERFLRKSPTENLRNYVKWRTLVKFYKIWKTELPNDEKREQVCRQHTESYFTYGILPWFIEYLYDAERREDSLLIAQTILQGFLNMTENYGWLDEDTKSEIASKLQAMDIMVGYKDDMRHRQMGDQIYNDLEINGDWFKNLLTLEANHARIRLHSVHKTVVPPILSPFSVNAFYADYINTAFVTMGISQMPLYHTRFPASLKYGGLGMLIGHEMAHALDSNGYHVNYEGKPYNWSSSSLRHFQQKIRCLENQYNKFIYHGIQTNGSATMPDNIADNAGTRLAHHSYMDLYGRNEGLEKPLPGLEFTNNELFFIKMAQTWCSGRDDSYKLLHMKTDAHAYAEFRVLGPLRNMPEFSETFQCKLGSQMNPLKKCVVW